MAVINTNAKALFSQAALKATDRSMSLAMQQLSTGKRINSARDDAAGLSIATRMTHQIRSLNQAVRNAGDAINLIQTAEGATNEITDMMQRMRELAVQAVNDTNSNADRSYLDLEFQQLKQQIVQISDNTEWNGFPVLNGKAGQQVGEMPVYKVTSDNQSGGVFIQPTTTRTISGSDAGEIQAFSLNGTPTSGVINVGGVDVSMTPTETTVGSAAQKIVTTLNSSSDFQGKGITASYAIPSADPSTVGLTETNKVTFNALTAVGQSVSFGGVTVVAGGALTANDVATAFATGSLPYGKLGTVVGSLSGYTTGSASNGAVTFTSTIPNANTNPNATITGIVLPPVAPTTVHSAGVGAPSTDVVTFGALTAGQSVTVAGLTFTATSAVAATDLYNYFAGAADGSTPANQANGVFTGSITGWSTGPAAANQLNLTSTANAAVAVTLAAGGTPGALTISNTPGLAATNVTFTDMSAGDSVTVAGKTFTASVDVKAAQAAEMFSTGHNYLGANVTPTFGTFSGGYTPATLFAPGASTPGSAVLKFTSAVANVKAADVAVTSNYARYQVNYSAASGDVPDIKVLSGATNLTTSAIATSRMAVTQTDEVFASGGKYLQSGGIKISIPSGATAGSAISATFINSDNVQTVMTGTLSTTSPAVVSFKATDGLNGNVITSDLTYTLKDSAGGNLDLTAAPRDLSLTVGIEGSIPALHDGDLLINGVNVGPSVATDDVLSPRNNAAGSAIAKAAAINRIAVDQGISQGQIQSLTFSGTPLPGTITVGGVNVALTADDNTPELATKKIAAALEASPQFDSSTGRKIIYAAGSASISVSFPPSEGSAAAIDIASGVTGLGSVVNTTQPFATKQPGTGVFAKVNENVFNGQAMKNGTVESGVIFINGFASAQITTVYNNSQATRDNVVRAINLISDKTGVKAINTGSDDKGISLVAADGRNIEVQMEPSGQTNVTDFAQRIGMREGVQSSTISLESKIQAPVVLSSDASGDIARAGLQAGNYTKNQAVLNTKQRPSVDASVAQVSSVMVANVGSNTSLGQADAVSVVVNGTTFSVTGAQANSGSPQDVTNKLITMINANSTLGVFATKGDTTGQLLLTSRTPGVAFTMTATAGTTQSVTASDITQNHVADSKSLGMNDLQINGIAIRPTTPNDDKFSINTVSSSDPAASALAVAAAINDSSSLTGVKAYANPAETAGSITTTDTPVSGKQSLWVNGIEIQVDFTQNESATDRRTKVMNAINQRTGEHGVTATDNGQGITLKTDGRNLSVWYDSSKKDLSASDFGLDKGGAVAQVSKVQVSGRGTGATSDTASVMINGVTVNSAALPANATSQQTAAALAAAINSNTQLQNVTAKVDPNNTDSVLITSNVAGTAFDVRSPAVSTSSAQSMQLSTVTANSPGSTDVSAVDMSSSYMSNVLGSSDAPLSAMNIRTVYGNVRMVSDAPVLPTLPGSDGLTPASVNSSGRPIQITSGSDGFGAMSNFMDLGFNEGTFGGRASIDMDPPRVGRVAFQVGSGANQVITIDLADFGKNGPITGQITGDVDLAVDQRSVRINTSSGATAVLNLLDTAMDKVNATRATMGAVMNRLDHVINNLTNVSMNMSASRSQIEDADYAQSSTELAKAQIMQQAATAVLAQANTSQQSVMKLLGG